MRLALCICALLLLTACQRSETPAIQSYVFGTLVDIHLPEQSAAQAQQLAGQLNQQFSALHQQLHAWQADSELSQLNQALAQGRTMSVSPLLQYMLRQAQQLSAQSGGLFNPAIGRLIGLWGFHRDEFSAIEVDPQEITRLVKANAQMSQLSLHQNQVSSTNRQLQIDLGGYAKGYALDVAANYLRTQGVKNALVNIGGNIIALGQHQQRPWQVAIQHPRAAGAMAMLDLPDGWAVGTSGDYQRFFEKNGQRYCHIIDPRTGYPVQATQSVTVLIPPSEQAGVMSDVASKPIFIATDLAERIQAAQAMQLDNYLIVEASGRVLISRAMSERIRWLQQPKQIQIIP